MLRVRACETDPALEERKKQAVLPALRVSAVPCRGARGLLLTLVCPAGGRLAEAPRLPPYVASAAALLLGPPPKETRLDDAFFFFCSTLSRS